MEISEETCRKSLCTSKLNGWNMRNDLSILEKTRELGVGSYEHYVPFCSFVFLSHSFICTCICEMSLSADTAPHQTLHTI